MTVGELLVILAGYDPSVKVLVEGDGEATGVDWARDVNLGDTIIINDYPTNA